MLDLPTSNSISTSCSSLTGHPACTQAARTYLTCVVRLSSEKEPERFAALVEQLAARGALTRHGLVPFLLAAADTVRFSLSGPIHMTVLAKDGTRYLLN